MSLKITFELLRYNIEVISHEYSMFLKWPSYPRHSKSQFLTFFYQQNAALKVSQRYVHTFKPSSFSPVLKHLITLNCWWFD